MSQERFTNKLAAISIADLLILRDQLGPQGLDAEMVALFGYERVPRLQEDGTALVGPPFGQSQPVTPLLEDALEIPTELPSFPFLQATEATTLKVDPPEPMAGNPISDRELLAPKNQPALPLRPLIRWSKFARHLKNRFGSLTVGSQLDTRQMIRLACSGHPVAKLPRLKRLAWTPQIAILWDDSSEMAPFAADAVQLCWHLKDERGQSGFKVIKLKGPPRLQHLAQIPARTPILAISAMGQLDANVAVQHAWLMFAKRLKRRGDIGYALNPCPRDRWNARLASAWLVTLWDRRHRLLRRGGMTAVSPSPGRENTAETLLTWLAPARIIESALVREVRLQLGSAANAGTEWDAWKHTECQQGVSNFGFLPGEAYDKRLKQRRELACAKPELAARIDQAIRRLHETCSPVIAAEANLRLCLSGPPDTSSLETVSGILSRVVDRLRRLAMNPLDREGVECGLPKWFPEMVQRLSVEMRRDDLVKELIGQGLALCDTWQKNDGEIPLGVDREAYAMEARAASLRVNDAGVPVDYIVGLNGPNLAFVRAGLETKVLKPLGRMTVGGARRVNVIGSAMQSSLQLDGGSHSGILLNHISSISITTDTPQTNLQLQSSHGTLDFKVIDRPGWAERFWYDRFGIAAEFSIRDVPFVLRWIPPGQFLMGSPESEVGRYSDEGPQHSVAVIRGYWLGETPVTQGQWEAAVVAGMEQRLSTDPILKPKPSRFQGTPDLPVEQVNWHASNSFCSLLGGLFRSAEFGGFRFQLPTEAQWEYACRAGTQSAFHNGSTCTVPEGFDPALDQLGWFDKNSEQKTHAVKGKQPNNWGLFDMHGNVWEWCADSWDSTMYRSRSAGVEDPVTAGVKSADRVMRGGSWGVRAQCCRAAYRRDWDSGSVWGDYGLRLSAGHEPGLGAERPVP